MSEKTNVLIVGAGPAGLAAALELARYGIEVRILDKAAEAQKESRAVAINPRTLELLDHCGASARLIAAGVKLKGARIVVGGRVRATFDATRLTHRYNFMLGLAQSETERLLAATLAEHGVKVERGVEVTAVEVDGDRPSVRARTKAGETTITADWIVGADGAHSAVRNSLDLDFPGAPYPFHWSLVDVDLAGDAEEDHAELRLDWKGPILVRVPLAPGRHRVISNGPGVFARLPASWKPGQAHWQSDFSVSHRMVKERGRGRVWLIGDAAHIHSPAGGRGMNLGIEDGVSFARCIHAGASIAGWAARRQQLAARVVRESDAMQRLATSQGFFGRRIAPALLRSMLRVGPVHDILVRAIAGFSDHRPLRFGADH
jgi:2-polyprenyl-6-methoxyphenol hydroxylase-like FAD-dependent oxidoreductase